MPDRLTPARQQKMADADGLLDKPDEPSHRAYRIWPTSDMHGSREGGKGKANPLARRRSAARPAADE